MQNEELRESMNDHDIEGCTSIDMHNYAETEEWRFTVKKELETEK